MIDKEENLEKGNEIIISISSDEKEENLEKKKNNEIIISSDDQFDDNEENLENNQLKNKINVTKKELEMYFKFFKN
jgi:hypothetical protein